MKKRTRLVVAVAAAVMMAGLGTGLVASYVGLQNIITGSDGPAELALVPQDARMVAYANVRDVMDSDLRQKFLQIHPEADFNGPNEFTEQTGIDIERDVDYVVASMSGENVNRPLLLARGRFDEARIDSLVRQHGGQAIDYQGVKVFTHGTGEGQAAVAFLEPGLAAIGTLSAVQRSIDVKRTGAANATSNADLMRHVRDVDGANAWTVARFDALAGGAKLPDEIRNFLPPITWVSASGHVNGGVRALLRAEARDEAAAANLREVIQGFMALARLQVGQNAQLSTLINSLQMGGEGNTVSLGFEIGPEVLDALAAIAPRTQQPAPAPAPAGTL